MLPLSKKGPFRPSLPWLFVFCLGLMQVRVWSFNLDLESVQIKSDPTLNKGRDSYFGYSVALHHNYENDEYWLLVGAPRANSSHEFTKDFTEPGALFKCDLQQVDNPCQEVQLQGSEKPTGYSDMMNNAWLGAALDSQPTKKKNRQVSMVCAPRWKNQYYSKNYLMNGACYWLNASLPDSSAHKIIPLLEFDKQTSRNVYHYWFGQAGMSIHLPENNAAMVLGAPGVYLWKGTVIKMEDYHGSKNPNEADMYSSTLTPHPYHSAKYDIFDLNGYAVTSGRFYEDKQLVYVSGAPRGGSLTGKVLIFTFPEDEEAEFNLKKVWIGDQVGENFGASLASADIDGNGYSDLVVGSPTYSEIRKTDVGRIQVFLSYGHDIRKESSHSGLNKPLARFGTTLASPGDLNHDGYEDIAVGAPWEDDGKGAMYIYLGSERGLRQGFSQRITPDDFSDKRPLKGFGMAISRGIDLDKNGYPDLAIGSFGSGHALVLKSRPIASLDGHVESIPPSIDLDSDTSTLTIKACVNFDGHQVPQTLGIIGNITLDAGHPAPRITFSGNDGTFKVEANKAKRTCQQFEVQAQTQSLATDVRRPISVIFNYDVEDKPGDRLNLPIIDSDKPKSSSTEIPIDTDCSGDICKYDMQVKVSFKNHRDGDRLIIGSDSRPEIEILVTSTGESVFLPNVSIIVPKPFSLFMPTSHSCSLDLREHTNELVCKLTNPIKENDTDTVNVIIDASNVKDTSAELMIDVFVAGDGMELNKTTNFEEMMLKLEANAELELTGYSRSEQVMYPRLDENTVNTTNPIASFTHHFTLVKKGPTPLEKVEVTVDIPVNITNGGTFMEIYAPKTNFKNQLFQCNLEGATFSVEQVEATESGSGPVHINGSEDSGQNNNHMQPKQQEERSVTQTDETLKGILDMSCLSDKVSCAQLKCSINAWPGGMHLADFSIKMDVNFSILAHNISVRDGAAFISTGNASIISLNEDVLFIGKRIAATTVQTDLQPMSLPSHSIPWWYYLLAILAGLLLFIILALIMYKKGFFRRKKQEEMKEHRARVASMRASRVESKQES